MTNLADPPRAAFPDAASSTALFTDHYELTMLQAALADGSAQKSCVFEVFARRLPEGRRYGVVAGTGRFLEALAEFRFNEAELAVVEPFLDATTLEWLKDFRFNGDVDGYCEGELYFPNSPILSVRGAFGECVILETLILSVFNHDSAIAAAAARMAGASANRALVEMGSRRTHEQAAVASARAAWIAGFASTSNLSAARRYGIPTTGTSAHAFTLLHTTSAGPDELAAFQAQVAALGPDTTLLVDTYDIATGVQNAVLAAGPELGAVRIDSGDLGVMARKVRAQLDSLGAANAKIVVSGDLDEYLIAALRGEPIDVFGVGTSLVAGSGAPTAGMVYKLVEVEGVPVAKRSASKQSTGGAKSAWRVSRPSGVYVEELTSAFRGQPPQAEEPGLTVEPLQVPLVRGGEILTREDLATARARVAEGLRRLPWEGLSLSPGDPALTVRHIR
ncbi:nicotinate phosphoribosyltransferase [Segniliparus rotundus DSM 44985]|uniref:Nicotinate phosphoribosyltransferase n=1 Tax=Segniliparus rotundus (strain ATCC BAA-972 / CDC 1076 / CIP 108378 / DSM 44985 / JCM 13578) TaxID=640132 RepID=D6Z7P7_SEGRD|nr:nicotinate phosphoribosyltransferase [Segniliparus rotundus]ADG97977.1 nicotinate phosphoribosyltransferase [Segniliparus rotundus DSM 44985]